MEKEPKWFTNFRTENDLRWKKQDAHWEKQEKFNLRLENRIDNLVTKNKLVE